MGVMSCLCLVKHFTENEHSYKFQGNFIKSKISITNNQNLIHLFAICNKDLKVTNSKSFDLRRAINLFNFSGV